MRLEGVDLVSGFSVALHEVIVAESEIFLFFSGNHELLLEVSESLLSFEEVGLELSVSNVLVLSLSLQIRLVAELTVKVSLESLGLDHESGVFILRSGEFVRCLTQIFLSSSQFKFSGISEFGKLVCSLLSLVEVVVNRLDSSIVFLAFALFHSNGISKSIDLILVSAFLLSQFSQLVLEVVSFLSQAIGLVTLGAALPGQGNAFLFAATDLVAHRADLGLQLVVGAVLLVEQEAQVLDLLAARVDGDGVLVMSVIVIVILHQFLVLRVSVLLLDGVELVSQRQVVLVALLDLEDFGLQLGNQKVLLVACQVHGVVVLHPNYEKSKLTFAICN